MNSGYRHNTGNQKGGSPALHPLEMQDGTGGASEISDARPGERSAFAQHYDSPLAGNVTLHQVLQIISDRSLPAVLPLNEKSERTRPGS